ncbi:MAG: carbohydrate porin [Rikenellaceae bacterium]
MNKLLIAASQAILIYAATTESATGQTIIENDKQAFFITGYTRTGFGYSKDGATQAHFQTPGALNKYSLANQADTYTELAFNYSLALNKESTKSLDIIWMASMYEDFGTRGNMSFNFTEQLFARANNLFGRGETIWVGKRHYDRQYIYMLDRFWLNPGQRGWGGGVENLINKEGSDEDLKIAAWQLKDEDVTSYINQSSGNLATYSVDLRWVNRAITEKAKLNLALNYSYRAKNEELEYDAKSGFGAFAWLEYKNKSISNTAALLLRQGANISTSHYSGISERENPANDNLVLNDLSKAYSIELNNEFLYDDLDRFAINAIFVFVARNYGTTPYTLDAGEPTYLLDRGNICYWVTAGARAAYYVSTFFRPTIEYSYEYIDNRQMGLRGTLNRVTFTPEFALKKGYLSRPVLRPFATYAFWSDELKGNIGVAPQGSPYANDTAGFTYGLQFEVWW